MDVWRPYLTGVDFLILLVGIVFLVEVLNWIEYWDDFDKLRFHFMVIVELLAGAWMTLIGVLRLMRKMGVNVAVH